MNTSQPQGAPHDRRERGDRRYCSFLVRIWAAGVGRRVEVEHVQSCERLQFDSLTAAFHWITDRSESGQVGAVGERR